MIYFNGETKKVHYNGFDISKIYACDANLVWSSETPPTPPTPTRTKLTYYTYDGSAYTIDCNSSSTLTYQEVNNSMREHGVVPNPMYNNSITEVEIGECVTVLGENVFNDLYSISSVTIPNTVTVIGAESFDANAFSSITIPSSVTSIGMYAFSDCQNLESIVIPSGVTTIDINTFNNCIRLVDIELPSTITSIGNSAFYFNSYGTGDSRYSASTYTSANRVIKIHATTPPTIGYGVFTNGLNNATYKIYVPRESVNAYKSASGWNYYADRIYPIPQPLTFVATESGTFKFSGNSIDYSLDSGTTWTTLASNTNSPTVSAGNKIMWKGTLTPTQLWNGIGTFSSSGRFTVEGNAMSLLYGDNFESQTDLSGKEFIFGALFSNCTGLTSAENLILQATTLEKYCYASMFWGCTSLTTAPQLPATTLAVSCYLSMFYGCSSLTTAPQLPATTLVDYCYYHMFNNCSNINNITCLATDISAEGCTSDWVDGVASSGTFTKAASMTSWTIDIDGIPTNWTVVDA